MACGLMMLGVVDGLSPQALAVEAEARGFESVFYPEHTHVPVGRPTIRFGDRALPDWYSHILDPFVALTAAAMATERIKVGTCVCLVAEHDPIALAKTVATLDVISGGRFIFGVGAGWNDLELADHGVAYKDRWAVTRENVLAMREIWTAEEAAFTGRFVEFGPLLSRPKPMQVGGPPVLVGSQSRWTWDRVVEYGDGWMPMLGEDVEEIARGMASLREAAERAGRAAESVSVSVWGVENAAQAEAVSAMGVDRLIFKLQAASPEALGPELDRYAAIAERLG